MRDNKTSDLKYYSDMKDATLSDLLRQVSIKNENRLMNFSNSSWQDCPETGRSKGAYIIFYHGVPIDHITHVPVPVSQSISVSEYNVACTAGMALEHFRILIHEFLNKDPVIFP